MYDGDLVLLVDEPTMLLGVDKDCSIVLNLDEKMTALAEEPSKENMAKLVTRTLVSLIGEASNASTCYHNKPYKTKETKARYDKNVEILSIVNSFAIDFAKTGHIMQIPYEVAKYSKPYPYFMRYAGEYYNKLYESMEKNDSTYKFQKSKMSNLNQLAFLLEKWHNKDIRWKRVGNFDYKVMMDDEIKIDNDKVQKIEKVFTEFNKECLYLNKFQFKLHNYDEFKKELKAWNKEEAMSYFINWESIYTKYRRICEDICPNKKELANIVVHICYELKEKSTRKKFIWAVASEGILENIVQIEHMIPKSDSSGDYKYLGKSYSLVKYPSLQP